MSDGREYPRSRSSANRSRNRNGARRSARAYEDVPDQRGAVNGDGDSDNRRGDFSRNLHERRPESSSRRREDSYGDREDTYRGREDDSSRSRTRRSEEPLRRADPPGSNETPDRYRSRSKSYDARDDHDRDDHDRVDYDRAGPSRRRSERRFDSAYDDEGLDENSLRWSSWDDLEEEDKRTHPRPGILARLPIIKRIKQPGLRVAAVVTLVAVLLCSLVSVPIGLVQYFQASALASSGVRHLRTAVTDLNKLSQNPFDKVATAQAHQELDAGIADFNQLDRTLNQIPGALTAVPGIGSRLVGAKRLIPIAVQGATAGTIVCDALTLLSSKLRNPLDATSQGLSQEDLTTLGKYLDQIQAIFTNVTAQINALTPSDLALDPRLGPGIAQFREQLPKLQQLMQDAKTFLGAAPTILGVGTPSTYLVTVMDSTEIRPGGGFIGNYGTMNISGGRLSDVHITDVDLLDRPFEAAGGFIPKPSQYSFFSLVPAWSFRDANLDSDFPTSAQNSLTNYKKEGGTADVQGVIAITPWLVRDAMKLTGPITVNEYNNEVVTSDTLVNAIHHHQLGANHGNDTIPDPESGSSQRKRFTALLFDDFFKQLKAIAAKDSGPVVKLFINAIRTKDIQFYSTNADAEKVLVNNHLGSAIEAPKTGDSFFLVDSNQTPNKANYFIAVTRQETITIDADGNAKHDLTLTFNWPKSDEAINNTYGIRTQYVDYIRVFAPPTSQLASQKGWTNTTTGNRFDRIFWGGRFLMNYGTTATVTLSWTVPKVAVNSGNAWTYQYLAQRQAGITWTHDTKIVLPSCAHIAGTPSGLVVQNPTTLGAKGPLSQDTTFEVKYTCS
jgi:uncharacterized protein DUF4012